MADTAQKTEKPTQKRLQKARREGKFPVSREFVGGLQFLAVVMILVWRGPAWLDSLIEGQRVLIRRAFQPELGPGDLTRLAFEASRFVFVPVLTAGACVALLTMGIHLATTGFGFSAKRLAPDWNRMNPLSRLQQLPKQNLFAVAQALLTLTLCGLALSVIARRDAAELFLLPLTPLQGGLARVFNLITDLLWKAAGVFAVLGCIDLFRQRRRFATEMKMTKQEIREELKEAEGNPSTKARIRRLQRALRQRKMMRQVPTATAVIVNPTHYAVAIRYDLNSESAPMVCAKGKNNVALRIRELAIRHEIPLVENPPLARALYKFVPLDGEIPAQLYRAVAEVLAYVFKVMNRM
jgi:flagellar biosynthesis protein FlhB